MSTHNLISKETLKDICPQLKQLRLERGLSLEEVQALAHISGKLLRRVEQNKCLPFSCLRKLLELYGKKMRIVIE